MKKTKLFIESYPITENRMSGIGHMTLEIIRALERHPENHKTFEIVLVVNYDRKDRLDRWGFKNVTVKTIPLPTRIFNILWKFDLLPPMDILLGRGVYVFPNYKNWRLLFSKSLTFVCDIGYLLFPQFVSPKNQKFLEKNIKKWVKRTDKVLAISQNAKEEIIQHLPVDQNKVLLTPCGVDPREFYERSSDEVDLFKADFGITGEYILYLGNLEPRKNIIKLIDAYKLLPSKLRNKYGLLLVGGGGWLNEPIIDALNQAKEDGYNIAWPQDYVPDEMLPVLHSGASLLVHPALYEGFGISPLQAMACGTPCIVSDNSSLPEVAGDAALYIDPDNEEDITHKMQELLTNESLRKKLIKNGYLQAEKYSWDMPANILVKECTTS